MINFIKPSILDTQLSLAPDLYTPEQVEILLFLEDHIDDLCQLSKLSSNISIKDDHKRVIIEEPCVCITYVDQHISSFIIDHSNLQRSVSLPPRTIIIYLTSGISTNYILNILKTELSLRQLKRSLKIDTEGKISTEAVSTILIPKRWGKLGKEIISRQLLIPITMDKEKQLSIRFLNHPFSEIDALANAVFATDNFISTDSEIVLFNQYIYIPSLNTTTMLREVPPDTPYDIVLTTFLEDNFNHKSFPTNYSELRPLLEMLQESNEKMGWINMPEHIAKATDLPSISIMNSLFIKLILNIENKDFEGSIYKSHWLESITNTIDFFNNNKLIKNHLAEYNGRLNNYSSAFASFIENLSIKLSNDNKVISSKLSNKQNAFNEFIISEPLYNFFENVIPDAIGEPAQSDSDPKRERKLGRMVAKIVGG